MTDVPSEETWCRWSRAPIINPPVDFPEDIVSVIDDKTFSVADSESGLRHYLSR